MTLLDRGALLAKRGLRAETVTIGPLGGEVRMRELSLSERLDAGDAFGKINDDDPRAQMRGVLGLVARMLLNEDESAMFPTKEDQEEMVSTFMDASSAAVQELMDNCLRINGMGKSSRDAMKDDLGNSEGIPTASSP